MISIRYVDDFKKNSRNISKIDVVKKQLESNFILVDLGDL